MLFRATALLLLLSTLTFAADQGVDATTVPQAVAKVEPPAPRDFPRAEALAAPAAIAKLIKDRDPKLVVIDARNHERYLIGHIPGARNIVSDTLQDTGNLPFLMPTREALKTVCAEAGINADSYVVMYDEDDGRLAARVWFTLHAYGHDHVAILDGGASKWKEDSREWSETLPAKDEGAFEPAETLRGVCTFDELRQFRTRGSALGKLPSTTLLDARALREYMGDEVRGKAGGHIPGAANMEWSAVLTGREHARVWKSPPEIHALLRIANVDKAEKIAVYDQAGGRSAHLYFTLFLMGYDQIFNYVAGWREYGNKDGVEIEK